MSVKQNLVEGKFLNAIRKKIDSQIGSLARRIIYKKGPVKENKLFVMTYDNMFADNEKYIVEELIRRKAPIDIVWVCAPKGDPDPNFPDEIRTVPHGTYEMFNEQASAKVWLDNALNCVWFNIPKKNNQCYMNTWHGSMGIKRLSGNAHWLKCAARCKKRTDFCITNSAFEENVFRTTFWPTNPFLKYGHARNDMLLHPELVEPYRKEVMEALGIPEGKKLMLYAPTFRDDGDKSCYNIDYALLKESLEKRFGGEWVILVRLHFKNRKNLGETTYHSDWLYDANTYPDMQKLMVAIDAGITDYSSWAYDFVLTKKPMFLYCPDIKKYNTDRGFYFPLESTPFLIAKNNKQLAAAVSEFDNDIYLKKVDEFLEEKGCYETGNAASLVADKILEVMGISD